MTARFDQLWEISTKQLHGKVQNREELMALYGIMAALDCQSYLEIGASCGGSMIVLAGVTTGKVAVVDLFEPESEGLLKKALGMVQGKLAIGIKGNSMKNDTIELVSAHKPYDVVMIDGGHKYETVASDWKNYGPMATKAVVFHDIKLSGVRRLWDEIGGGLEIVAKGSTMGFGVKFVHG